MYLDNDFRWNRFYTCNYKGRLFQNILHCLSKDLDNICWHLALKYKRRIILIQFNKIVGWTTNYITDFKTLKRWWRLKRDTNKEIFLRFCIVYCSQGNREQPAHYLKQYKNAGKRFTERILSRNSFSHLPGL